MKVFFSLVVVLLVLLCAGVVGILWHVGYFKERQPVIWDFTSSRSPAIVGWPTDSTWSTRDWWSSYTHQYEKVTILLPGRPPIVSSTPADVFFNRKAGQLIDIQINEDPIPAKEALDRLRVLAGVWGWPWDEPAYERWAKKADAGDLNSISAGDRSNHPLPPHVSLGIKPAIGASGKPCYLSWSISW